MRKRLIESEPSPQEAGTPAQWLDLGALAVVEVSSEDPGFPVESVFAEAGGWRAAACGEQSIRLVFDQPTPVRHIQLRFQEEQVERTHEFTLSYRGDGDAHEIVRQQWCFSPQGSTSEVEDYAVSLSGVRSLELKLKPDLQPERAVASLASWRVG